MADTAVTSTFEKPVAKESLSPEMQAKREEAVALIQRYSLFGSATGLIPFIGVDIIASTAVQTKMIKDLADIYEFDIDDHLLRTAVSTAVTAVAGRVVTLAATKLATVVGPLKMFIGGATNAAVAGFLTISVGNLYQSRMEQGEDPAGIGVMDIVDYVISQVQEGKWDPSKLSLTHQLTSMVKG